jgi:hypothetical protein
VRGLPDPLQNHVSHRGRLSADLRRGVPQHTGGEHIGLRERNHHQRGGLDIGALDLSARLALLQQQRNHRDIIAQEPDAGIQRGIVLCVG